MFFVVNYLLMYGTDIEREKFYMDDLKPCINHILDPVSLRRDAVFKERLSQAMKKKY